MTVDEIEQINNELDALSDKTYQSAESVWVDIAACLEKAGLQCPPADEALQDLVDNEILYKVDEAGDDTPFFLYAVFDSEGDKYEVFATIATQEDLDVLNAFVDELDEHD